MDRRHPRSTLFPYTTLFRSVPEVDRVTVSVIVDNYQFAVAPNAKVGSVEDRKSTRLNSSHVEISYAVFCLKKKNRLHAELCTEAWALTRAFVHSCSVRRPAG